LPEVNGNFAMLDAAVAEAGELPYVVGSYVGTSKSGNKTSLPFHPSFLVIGRLYGPVETAATGDAVMAFTGEGLAKVVSIEDDGFTPLTWTRYPQLNLSGSTYVYIAFR
jgi:hypothetical protein